MTSELQRLAKDWREAATLRTERSATSGSLKASSYRAMIQAAELYRTNLKSACIHQAQIAKFWSDKAERLQPKDATSVRSALHAPSFNAQLISAQVKAQTARENLARAEHILQLKGPDLEAQVQHWTALLEDELSQDSTPTPRPRWYLDVLPATGTYRLKAA
ncbi:hypothetical protein BFP70_12685 [Thioclava sp. SK-1]|uniref:hypothetical protein n=1 Tax=Thioclava sp. SK-1 TaxID=1889770 RepID=UPI0008250725|nr:hypothetical protein [Thioclava sp. SK-1]OCX63067.1 hypothetical protein BFP70_12685 [Thioclava sp. SK-1]